MHPPLAEHILNKLQAAPFSAVEIAFDLGDRAASIGEIKRAIASLLSAGLIIRLKTDRAGGPFYALVGYVEPASWRDHSDLALNRDYSTHYESVNEMD